MLCSLALFGCVAPGRQPIPWAIENHLLCKETLRRLPLETEEAAQRFMTQCDALPPLSGTSGYVSAPLPLYQSPPRGGYGQPDAFGPYGVWGPTWESFNGYYQNPPPRR
jgi:hypothetical protein